MQEITEKDFKIRCSAISQIMTVTRASITEKQAETIREYEAKEKITEKQLQTLTELKQKRDALPQLGKGAKTYCQKWLQQSLFDRNFFFTSKYTEKGTSEENQAIQLMKEKGLIPDFLEKNTEHFWNEYLTGTPDLLPIQTVDDTKCSWSLEQFPTFAPDIDNKAYIDQLEGYMILTKRKKARLVYCLVNTPINIVENEINRAVYGIEDEATIKKIEKEITKNHNFDDIPIKHRIKVFEFDQDPTFEAKLKECVEACRAYIKTLLDTYINN